MHGVTWSSAPSLILVLFCNWLDITKEYID